MRLLSLDIATVTGWASGDTSMGDPVSGLLKIPKGLALGPFLVSFSNQMVELVREQQPDVIVFEEPIMPRGMTQMAVLLKLYNLIGQTEKIAAHLGIEIRQVAAGTWKKGFTGSGAFGKSANPYPPLKRCHELSWEHVRDHNEADALGIWVFSSIMLDPGSAVRFDPLFRAEQSISMEGTHGHA